MALLSVIQRWRFMKNTQDEAKCAVCGEPAKHKLKDQAWCGNTPCYFEIATVSDEDAEQQEEV